MTQNPEVSETQSPPFPPPFTHEPLLDNERSIRLLRIEAVGTDEDQNPSVSCQLKPFDTAEAPSYQALSYMWGTEVPVLAIKINGRAFSVRQNLHDFLLAARRNNWVEGWLWVDQICIDQSNVLERNQQVQNMSAIYQRADEVIVWLGDQGELGDRMIKAYQDEAHRTRAAKASVIQMPEPIATAIESNEAAQIPEHIRRDLAYRNGLGKNPYWQRLWAAQEIYLARNVSVSSSDSLLQWDDVQYAFGWWMASDALCIQLLSGRIEAHGVAFHEVPSEGQSDVSPFTRAMRDRDVPLLLAMTLLHQAECQDPRDYIYGMMAIVRPQERISIDYSRSAEEVLLDVLHKLFVTMELDGRFLKKTKYVTWLASRMGLLGPHNVFENMNHYPWDERLLRVYLELFICCPGKPLQPLTYSPPYSNRASINIERFQGREQHALKIDGVYLESYVFRHDLAMPELEERLQLYQKIAAGIEEARQARKARLKIPDPPERKRCV